MKNENACYGKMFPSVASMTLNQAASGEVFGYRVDHSGQVVQKREAIVNRKGWDRCQQCPDMEGCYRVSTGTLLIELALRTVPPTIF